MTDDEKRVQLFNPLASFHIEGEPDDPETYLACIDLYGEAGERVQILYPDSGDVESLTEMLTRAQRDLAYAEDYGIHALANKVGYAEEDSMLTVDDILNAPPEADD